MRMAAGGCKRRGKRMRGCCHLHSLGWVGLAIGLGECQVVLEPLSQKHLKTIGTNIQNNLAQVQVTHLKVLWEESFSVAQQQPSEALNRNCTDVLRLHCDFPTFMS